MTKPESSPKSQTRNAVGWGVMHSLLAFVTAGLVAVTGCKSTNPGSNSKAPSVEMTEHLHPKKAQAAQLEYLLFLPKGYESKSGKRWPLILFLHGSGERGTDIWKVATHGPTKHLGKDGEFPFVVVSPQCPEGKIWSNDTLL